MPRGTKASGAVVGLAGVLAMTGCASAAPAVEHAGDVRAVQLGALSAADVARSQTAFGLDLAGQLCGDAAGTLLLSPTAVAEVLGMLQPAARGATADSLAALLHTPAWSDDLVAAQQAHTAALAALRSADKGHDTLEMSNRLWTALGIEPERAVLDDLATAFDASVWSVDFAGDPSGATRRINDSVAADTHDLITRLFDEDLPADTPAVLTDVIYLHGTWTTPFSDTFDAPFHARSGDVTMSLMVGGDGALSEADGWQQALIPYVDGTMAARVILPPQGVDPCDVSLDVLTALTDAPAQDGDVAIPRLHVEHTYQLGDPLAALGLDLAGDYSGLGPNLGISQVVLKTVLDMDEEGTTAAAAAGAAMAGAAPVERPSMVVDRPYVVILTDLATGSPLFLAVVQDPTA